jgi:hypothetical protein
MSALESAKERYCKNQLQKVQKLLSAHAIAAAALFNKQQQLHDNSTSTELLRTAAITFRSKASKR